MAGREKCSATNCRPWAPSCWRSAGGIDITWDIAEAMAVISPTGTTRPVVPGCMVSAVPVALVATTGMPAAEASRTLIGRPSQSED